jgi:ketosteroid isomerase-like protein
LTGANASVHAVLHVGGNDLEDLAKELIAAWNRLDAGAYVAACDPDVEFFSLLAKVEGGEYRGHEGIRQYFRDIEALDRRHIEIESVVRVGDRVAVRQHVRGEGQRSGIMLDATVGNLLTFRDGRLARLEAFLNPAQALAALGLTEWPDDVATGAELR